MGMVCLCGSAQIDDAAGKGKPLLKSLVAKYKEEIKASLEKCIAIYTVACGADHLVVQIAKAKLAAVDKPPRR